MVGPDDELFVLHLDHLFVQVALLPHQHDNPARVPISTYLPLQFVHVHSENIYSARTAIAGGSDKLIARTGARLSLVEALVAAEVRGRRPKRRDRRAHPTHHVEGATDGPIRRIT